VRALVAGSLALAALSLLVAPGVPSYDPWAWLLWGRELAWGSLDTAEGPAFKPLPVAVCTLLAPLGDAAPLAWVTLARAGAIAAVGLAFALARQLAGGSLVAGVAAGAGVALCGALVEYSAAGSAEGLLVAGALGAIAAWRSGRPRLALACGVGCALLRVEAWPFVLAAAVVHCRRRPGDRPAAGLACAAVPLLWLVPEAVASGELWRSGARAQVTYAWQPASADFPALESARRAVALMLAPVALGVPVLLRRPRAHAAALLPAAAGGAWIAIVALMAEAGFSGEERYALPGVAVASVSGGAGLALAARSAAARLGGGPRLAAALPAVAALAAVALVAAPRAGDLTRVPGKLRYQERLSADLDRAVRVAGGREAVLACGRPYVGRLRGPLLAYRLGVVKRRVAFAPRAPGIVFSSRLVPGDPWQPRVPGGYRVIARVGAWRVFSTCGGLDRASAY
jgi:hypothetical protein